MIFVSLGPQFFFAKVYQYSEAYLDKKFCQAEWMSVNIKASLCV
jgi:hypothetical protein